MCQSQRRKRSIFDPDDLLATEAHFLGSSDEMFKQLDSFESKARSRRIRTKAKSTRSLDPPEEELPNLDIFLNPDREQERLRNAASQKQKYQERFAGLDSAASFHSMFELLWYSGNPCFDVLDLTSDSLHQKSVVKHCLWKGEEVNCSTVFSLTPTDRGMCCRFDVKRQEAVFQETRFSQALERLQEQDLTGALDSGAGTRAVFGGDPGPEVGRHKGLTLVLDSHTDLLSPRSVAEDSTGFLIGLTGKGEFPLMGQVRLLSSPCLTECQN